MLLFVLSLLAGYDCFFGTDASDLPRSSDEIVEKMNNEYEGEFELIGVKKSAESGYSVTTTTLHCSRFPDKIIYTRERIKRIEKNLWEVLFDTNYSSHIYKDAQIDYLQGLVSVHYTQCRVFPCSNSVCYDFLPNLSQEDYINKHFNHAASRVVVNPYEAAIHKRKLKNLLYLFIRNKHNPNGLKIFFMLSDSLSAITAEAVKQEFFIDNCYAVYEFFEEKYQYKTIKAVP